VNLAVWLARDAALHPDHVAVRHGEDVLTYAELSDRVARLAGFMRDRGLTAGDRVGIIQWNGPRLLETLLAAFHGGFCVVPVNARATPYEAAQVLDDAEVGAVVYGPEYAEQAMALNGRRPLRLCLEADASADAVYEDAINRASGPLALQTVAADDVAWLFYTSGTTGTPKGAMLTHRNLLAMVLAHLADLRDLRPHHVVLHAAPLTHGSGLYALPAIARGATQVITTSRSFDPEEILETVQSRGVSDIAFLTPTMVKWLTEAHQRAAAPIESLEHAVYGGAPMYREDLRAALDAFGPVFSQIYGQAEAPVTIARLTREEHLGEPVDGADLLGAAGRAYTSVEVAVANAAGLIAPTGDGELVTRSDVVMKGYWRNPTATADSLRGGWLHTGDVGRIDSGGLVFLVDRSKDVIISGGANIYPREVEEVILRHGEVRQAVVVGAPDETWGERVVAVLVLEPGGDQERVQRQLDALCREYLSDYKRPRRYDWMNELPVSPYGKVLKREVRATYWQGRERQV
jgi:acyl-CoA synthetase (AMP-forming)/AMP-acid ligase II